MGEGDVGMIIGEIRRRVSALRSRDVLPRHVLLLDLRRWAHSQGIPRSRLDRCLDMLRRSGRIEVGRTLNDFWIRPVEDGETK